jgi:hypothetical protein
MMSDEYLLSRRTYLIMKACKTVPPIVAMEVVATSALSHPEWDMEESKPWAEWESRNE